MIAANPPFASRLLRGMAALNASRVRRLTEKLRSKELDTSRLLGQAQPNELVGALAAFKDLLLQTDRDAISKRGVIDLQKAEQVRSSFTSLLGRFEQFMRASDAEIPPSLKLESAALVQREVLPFLLLTKTAERMFSKPRGYAGDCETIDMMYENIPAGSGRIGPLLDSCFLATSAVKAVRNRRQLLREQILATLERSRPARVASLACGPAAEAFDVFAELADKSHLHLTAVDIDRKSLEMVQARAAGEGLTAYISTHQANLVYLAAGKQTIDLTQQALIYSIGLIDYFKDGFVIKLLNWVHDCLEPGGRVVLGNFHPRNPNRAMMDYVLEWRLIHRDEDKMNEVFQASRFASPCSRILFEEEGIDLFAEGIKRD